MTALGPDVTPLRGSRDYRLLYGSSAVSLFGSMVTAVAAPLQLKELTGSTVAVGLIGVAEVVPMIVCSLWGGAIADVHDRRRVLLLTEVAALLGSLLLAVNAMLPAPSVAGIYTAAAAASAAAALHRPSAEAMLARLVPREQQSAGRADGAAGHGGHGPRSGARRPARRVRPAARLPRRCRDVPRLARAAGAAGAHAGRRRAGQALHPFLADRLGVPGGAVALTAAALPRLWRTDARPDASVAAPVPGEA